jgi:Zn-dependent protease
METVFFIIVLLFAVVIHEVSHGAVANALGDPTAKYAGRLTLNPLKHLDPWGSFLFPILLLVFSGGRFVFGWAKPVPFNPYNLRYQRWGPALVGLAGPAANFSLAVLFAGLIRLADYYGLGLTPFFLFFHVIVWINLVLGTFNLVPIPPLDGSKILFAAMPYSWESLKIFLEQYGFIILIIFLFLGFQFLIPLVLLIYGLLVGSSPLLM